MIDEKIKQTQDERDDNTEFCFKVFSNINQKVHRSMLIFRELMNIIKNKQLIAPESGIFS